MCFMLKKTFTSKSIKLVLVHFRALDDATTPASSTVTCTIVVTNVAPSFLFEAVSVEFAVATVSGILM